MKNYLLVLLSIILIVSACASAEAASPLAGTTWKLTAFGSVASQGSAMSEEGTLTFSRNGKVTGVGACNQFDGDYKVSGDQITFSALVWGNELCPMPQMMQESGVFKALSGTVSFKIEGNTLTITNKDMDQVLVFEKAAGA